MSWNNGLNKTKFNKTQKEQETEYRQNGMTEEQIQIMRKFDLEIYNSDRRFAEHTQAIISDDGFDGETKNPLLKNYYEQEWTKQETVQQTRSLNWLDEISNPALIKAIESLSKEDQEILTQVAIYEHSHEEVARSLHTSRQCITSKVRRIRKRLLQSINSIGGEK